MANSITLAQKYVPVIDALYKKESLTAVLDATTKLDFTGANTVNVLKVSTTGLGDYSRANGYPEGDATATWEALTLSEERGKEFSIDRMDNEETLGMAFGAVTSEFMREHVAPELDAYRFAKYASVSGVGSKAAAIADGAAAIAAIREGTTAMNEAEVPATDRILFITPTKLGMIQDLDTTKSREVMKNFSAVVEVPQSRFVTGITLNDGSSAWGYTKAEGAKDIDFMIVSKSAVLQIVKFALPKIFDPDTNQKKDAWAFQYRQYHDAFVYDNKVKGVYVHTNA